MRQKFKTSAASITCSSGRCRSIRAIFRASAPAGAVLFSLAARSCLLATPLHRPRFRRDLADELFPGSFLARRPEQTGAPRDGAMQAPQELRTGLDPVQQPRKRCGVADRKIARIIA